MDDFMNCCRLCLVKLTNIDMIINTQDENNELLSTVGKMFDLEITASDLASSYVCARCSAKIRKIVLYQSEILANQKKVNQFISLQTQLLEYKKEVMALQNEGNLASDQDSISSFDILSNLPSQIDTPNETSKTDANKANLKRKSLPEPVKEPPAKYPRRSLAAEKTAAQAEEDEDKEEEESEEEVIPMRITRSRASMQATKPSPKKKVSKEPAKSPVRQSSRIRSSDKSTKKNEPNERRNSEAASSKESTTSASSKESTTSTDSPVKAAKPKEKASDPEKLMRSATAYRRLSVLSPEMIQKQLSAMFSKNTSKPVPSPKEPPQARNKAVTTKLDGFVGLPAGGSQSKGSANKVETTKNQAYFDIQNNFAKRIENSIKVALNRKSVEPPVKRPSDQVIDLTDNLEKVAKVAERDPPAPPPPVVSTKAKTTTFVIPSTTTVKTVNRYSADKTPQAVGVSIPKSNPIVSNAKRYSVEKSPQPVSVSMPKSNPFATFTQAPAPAQKPVTANFRMVPVNSLYGPIQIPVGSSIPEPENEESPSPTNTVPVNYKIKQSGVSTIKISTSSTPTATANNSSTNRYRPVHSRPRLQSTTTTVNRPQLVTSSAVSSAATTTVTVPRVATTNSVNRVSSTSLNQSASSNRVSTGTAKPTTTTTAAPNRVVPTSNSSRVSTATNRVQTQEWSSQISPTNISAAYMLQNIQKAGTPKIPVQVYEAQKIKTVQARVHANSNIQFRTVISNPKVGIPENCRFSVYKNGQIMPITPTTKNYTATSSSNVTGLSLPSNITVSTTSSKAGVPKIAQVASGSQVSHMASVPQISNVTSLPQIMHVEPKQSTKEVVWQKVPYKMQIGPKTTITTKPPVTTVQRPQTGAAPKSAANSSIQQDIQKLLPKHIITPGQAFYH